MPDPSLLQRLKERKLVQWALAYFAGAFVVLQLLDALAEPLGLSPNIQRAVLVVVGIGFFITLVLAWYHGEKGRQRVSGPELLMVTALLVVAGVALTTLRRTGAVPRPEVAGTFPSLEDDRPSIAVLPLDNFSPDPSDAFFADGVHEEIISRLSKVASLRVISRNSVMRYREERKLTREVARELGVAFILEGSARIGGGMVRLTLQLIDGDTDEHLWSEEYDRPYSVAGFIPIQSEIAQEVARTLRVEISPDERARIAAAPTENTAAFDEYLIGRSWLRQRTEESFRRAIEHFEYALEADSTYALAYVGLADTYSLLGSYRHLPAEEASSFAKEMAGRALELDGTLGEAYASLGYVQYRFDWDYESSFLNLQRAVDLNPNNAEAYQWYAMGLSFLGRVEEAVPLIQEALGLDPLNFNIRRSIGSIFKVAREYDRAVGHLEQALAINPGYPPAQADLGQILILMGNREAGLPLLEDLNESQNEGGGYVLLLAWAYATSGREREAQEMLEGTLENPTQWVLDPVAVARVYTGLGEPESAFEWLERGYESRSPSMAGVGTSAAWDPLREDPRFQDLLVRLGLLGG